jgi:hypothetical protein
MKCLHREFFVYIMKIKDLPQEPNQLVFYLQSLGYNVTELASHFGSENPLLFCSRLEKSVFVAKYEPKIHTEMSLFLTKLVAENVGACILDSEFNPMFGGIDS